MVHVRSNEAAEMTRISLNQTESEKRLHRIFLTILKLFRALVLRWVLVILAIAFYMAFGITGLDPTANGTINSLRPVIPDPRQSLYFVSAVLIIVVLITFAGGMWLYKSIVRVWRKSLKAQSIILVIFVLLPSPFFDGQLFLFSYNNFDPLFTILFGLSSVFLWWYSRRYCDWALESIYDPRGIQFCSNTRSSPNNRFLDTL